jgi:hypothetical protein
MFLGIYHVESGQCFSFLHYLSTDYFVCSSSVYTLDHP